MAQGYFKPLRRKMGVLTLALACVFAAGWIRSLARSDLIISAWGKRSYSIQSMCGELSIDRLTTLEENKPRWYRHTSEITPTTWRVLDEDGNPRPVDHLTEDIDKIEWRWDWLGFHFGAGQTAQGRDEIYAFPYWSIVIPLTLLSAWLLLVTRGVEKTPKPTQS